MFDRGAAVGVFQIALGDDGAVVADAQDVGRVLERGGDGRQA